MRRLLAEQLGRPQCTLNPFEDDPLVMRYFREGGYDPEWEKHLVETAGQAAADRYVQTFAAYTVQQGIADHPGHIIEVGATLSVYDDAGLLQQVQAALAAIAHVILLLPSPDHEESYQRLRARYLALLNPAAFAQMVKHSSYHALAKHTVYSKGKTPAEVCAEVCRLVVAQGRPQTPILLIGPPLAGKSTTSNLLEVALKLPAVGLDVVGWDYAQAAGYDAELLDRIRAERGEQAARRYTEDIWATAVTRAVLENPDAIIDMGAGHTVYDDPDVWTRFRAALAPYPSIILLLPSPDLDESVDLLIDRPRSTMNGVDTNKYMIEHPANYALAKRVVYTDGKTPEATRDEILAHLRL
jgi:hypothetical protein